MSMKETEGVKIIGLGTCPVVIRIRITLKIKGVPYEFVEEVVRTQGAGLSSSLKSDVVFLHRGRKIIEPYKIVQYIDATWKAIDTPSILPSDKYDSIVETFWVKFIDDKVCYTNCFIFIVTLIFIISYRDTPCAHHHWMGMGRVKPKVEGSWVRLGPIF